MRKSWHAALKLRPQEVNFLGDTLNRGSTEGEWGKDKQMERQGSWCATSNIADALTPDIGEGVSSLASGASTAIGVFKQFIIGGGITGGFWKSPFLGLVGRSLADAFVLAGIVMRLTH